MLTSLIAEKLGRTENGIRYALRHYGIRLMEEYQLWTAGEKEIIRQHFSVGISDVMQLLPGRTRGAINAMKNKLGVHNSRKWNKQERQVLMQYYSTEGIAVAKRLPGRTRVAVRQMAKLMNIPLPGSENRLPQQRWNGEEWRRLEDNMQLPVAELAALFPGRTQVSVRKARDRLIARQMKSVGA